MGPHCIRRVVTFHAISGLNIALYKKGPPLGILSQPKEDPMFDLKPLPDTLKYAYLDEKKVYPVIINSNLSGYEEERLLETLRRHRGAIGYTLDDLKGISPSICQ